VLQYGVGAGRFEGMEARIASLEAHVDHIRDDIGDMRLDLKELTKTMGTAGAEMREFDSRVNSLPTKGWMMATLLVLTVVICAVVIYIEQIRHFLGVVAPPTAL
jgi:t-SNARE complex subunit (syntaxin)